MDREDSDEAYVIGLCDEVLGEAASTQHRFNWLLGDPDPAGRRAMLPVDAYWPGHQLVVEYRERQHDEPVPHFDKPDRLTVSGVHRGEQRRLYDERRDAEIPAHGLRGWWCYARPTWTATAEAGCAAMPAPTSR